MVHHVVICWLKTPGAAAERQRLIDVSRSFASIPGVVAVKAGKVLPSERKVVDSSFDVAVVISLQDREALHAYQSNPVHKKAMKEVLAPLAEKVVVYDFIE